MFRMIAPMSLMFLAAPILSCGAAEPARDRIPTGAGDLEITFLGHGTLMFVFNGKTIHIDPWAKVADYSKLPKADLLFLTHDHYDHLDDATIKKVRTDKTIVVASEGCKGKVDGAQIMKNGDMQTVAGIKVEAVPAYNMVQKRPDGVPFHPKGAGNGYIFTFGDKRVFVAGDTENVPEVKALKNIDVAFLPMYMPYTMSPEMVAEVAKAMRPKILYPYHTGDTDVSKLAPLLKDAKDIDLRIRKME